MFIHIIMGIIFGYFIWKLLKITFKSLFWILLIGIGAALIFPKALFLVGGIGFLVLSALGALLVLCIAGLFFFEDN
jgi:hypothetical protein